ncbi:hypothetical protein [Streptomyces seoulensis]|uniref:hypothetical protein n=1 Tax=Streptomyces seoulensis TaxID=73044 RepID=UPI0033B12063
MPLTTAVERLPGDAESHDGYQHDLFKHWVNADRDGYDTRAEVVLPESRTEPTVHTGCRVVAGRWFSIAGEVPNGDFLFRDCKRVAEPLIQGAPRSP